MQGLHLVASLLEPFAEFFGHHYAAVLAAGAAEGNRQVALPFFNIVRKQVEHELGYAIEKLRCLRKSANVGGDFGIQACLFAKLRHEMRIGKKPHIEDHVGVPLDADMVFDVRFLPNPHFVPEFRKKTGLDPKVAAYVRGFPQTTEFLNRVTKLMLYLLPHYVEEGKSYLTIAFGCTGGQHRSVMMAEELARRLHKAGYQVKALHRDIVR